MKRSGSIYKRKSSSRRRSHSKKRSKKHSRRSKSLLHKLVPIRSISKHLVRKSPSKRRRSGSKKHSRSKKRSGSKNRMLQKSNPYVNPYVFEDSDEKSPQERFKRNMHIFKRSEKRTPAAEMVHSKYQVPSLSRVNARGFGSQIPPTRTQQERYERDAWYQGLRY